MKRRIAVLILALLMTLNLAPVYGIAEEDLSGSEIITEETKKLEEDEEENGDDIDDEEDEEDEDEEKDNEDNESEEEDDEKPSVEDKENGENKEKESGEDEDDKKEENKEEDEEDEEPVEKANLLKEEAPDSSVTVYVTISNKGNMVLPGCAVNVDDYNGNGYTDIDDALYYAHLDNYPEGASGYLSEVGYYGLSIKTLWGDIGPMFGYYVNDQSAWSLEDTVCAGDSVYAFIYSDQTDKYCFFDKSQAGIGCGSELILKVSYSGYDEYWSPVTSALAGAELTIDGKATNLFSNDSGEIRVTFREVGKYTLSIIPPEGMNLTPPCCIVKVNTPDTCDGQTGYSGLTDYKTPTDPDTTGLLWNLKLGASWEDSPSPQIIVDDNLIVMSGTKLYKLSTADGSIIASADMISTPSYALIPPCYAYGLIFCPLNGGIIQAFDAVSLQPKWTYTDPYGGQALSPITCSGGCIYTGFWTYDESETSYICLNALSGEPVWNKQSSTGYYWTESAAVGDFIIYGSDGDGLYCVSSSTGEVLSSLDLNGFGYQRSGIAYDPSSGRIYFTTDGGYLCSAKISRSGQIVDFKSVCCGAATTSTPVIYGGNVYFTCAGSDSLNGNKGNFVSADAVTLRINYSLGMPGYPQCELLLTDAYIEDGYLYFYSTYNAEPGGISMIKVKLGDNTSAAAELVELFNAKGFENWCTGSIITDSKGNLYYRNDSGNIFAIGTIENKDKDKDTDKDEDKDKSSTPTYYGVTRYASVSTAKTNKTTKTDDAKKTDKENKADKDTQTKDKASKSMDTAPQTEQIKEYTTEVEILAQAARRQSGFNIIELVISSLICGASLSALAFVLATKKNKE